MNKKLFLLLPFCLTLLPACTTSHTLTLFNSNAEAGTIITQNGKYKAGENIEIEVETFQGYKVDSWQDSITGKIGSRTKFNYCMLNRDVVLTVYYGYDDFELSFDYTISSDENHFDYNELSELIGSKYRPAVLVNVTTSGTKLMSLSDTIDITWKNTVTVDCVTALSMGSFGSGSITDEDGNVLGESSCTFEMPNHNKKLTCNVVSTSYGAFVSCNIPNVMPYCSSYNFSNCYKRMVNSYYQYAFYTPGTTSSGFISYTDCYKDEDLKELVTDYTFSHWLDLDTQEILTTDTKLNLTSLEGNHHYQCVLRKV